LRRTGNGGRDIPLNAGHTLEPHLHVGAKRNGAEIGLVFDGRWLSMN
jgi:hypothetical protein